MKYTTLVHFQFMKDEKALKQIMPYNFIASLVPNLFDKNMKFEKTSYPDAGDIFQRLHPENNYYPEWAKEPFKQFKDSDIPVIVEGYRHCCEPCFEKGLDPYHEFVCANKASRSFKQQEDITYEGIASVLQETGGFPIGECPPNHLWNKTTLKTVVGARLTHFVIRNGFDYLPIIGKRISLPGWKQDGLTILPESKNPGKAPLFYVMYSDIEEKGFEHFKPYFEQSIPLSELEIRDNPPIHASLSERVLYTAKKFRDWKNK